LPFAGQTAAQAQNPFFKPRSDQTVQKGTPASQEKQTPETTSKPSKSWFNYPFIDKIIVIQARLNQKISCLVREARDQRSAAPLLPLLAITFLYGILHAAGPGHGKAVAGSYILTQRQGVERVIALGVLIAFFHGMSGILIVFAARFVLETGVSQSMERTSHVVQLVSYGALAVLGAVLFISGLLKIRKGRDAGEKDSGQTEQGAYPIQSLSWKRIFSVAFFMGMVPCPGVVFVMLFCFSMGMLWLGVVLSITQILGMAITIACVVLIGHFGKKSLAATAGRFASAEIIFVAVELLGALMLTSLGTLLFLAALHS
jgi:ABC-type nickel/cobalt efflux system permease component RcnA